LWTVGAAASETEQSPDIAAVDAEKFTVM